MTGTDELEALAQVEDEGQGASEGPTMMGRRARELMLSGQGDAALQAFKVAGLNYPSLDLPTCLFRKAETGALHHNILLHKSCV